MRTEMLFARLFEMSVTAGWIVIVLVLLRPLLRKAPKALQCGLWALAAVRLLCPFSVESVLSLLPRTEKVTSQIASTVLSEPALSEMVTGNGTGVGAGIGQTAPSPLPPLPHEDLSAGVSSPQTAFVLSPMTILSLIWIVGMTAMLLWTAISYLRLHLRVRESIRLEKNVYLCDRIATPFVLGLFRPKIYLSSSVRKEDIPYVLAHERAHIRRRDHFWKPFGFALLTVYWFNPLLWVAYFLLCRDIELACDERVIREIGEKQKTAYSDALINCSVSRKMIMVCPVAFGEIGIKGRIKAVLNYKKPTVWVIIGAVLLCVVLAVGFLTNPPKSEPSTDPSDELLQNDSGQTSEMLSDGSDGSDGKKAEVESIREQIQSLTYEEKIIKHTVFTMWSVFQQKGNCSGKYTNYVAYREMLGLGLLERESYSRHWQLTNEDCNAMLAWVDRIEGTLKPVIAQVKQGTFGGKYYTFKGDFSGRSRQFDYIILGSKQYIVTENGTFQIMSEEQCPVTVPKKGNFTVRDLEMIIGGRSMGNNEVTYLFSYTDFVYDEYGNNWTLEMGDDYMLVLSGAGGLKVDSVILYSTRDPSYSIDLVENGNFDALNAFFAETADLPIVESDSGSILP